MLVILENDRSVYRFANESSERLVEITVDFLLSSLSLMQVKNWDDINEFVSSVPRSSIISKSQSKIYSCIFFDCMSLLSNVLCARMLKNAGAE